MKGDPGPPRPGTRSEFASASLKEDVLRADRIDIQRGFRGVFASASLKRVVDIGPMRRGAGYPRRSRLGLIEGSACSGAYSLGSSRHPRRVRLGLIEGDYPGIVASSGSPRIRGVFASASLKHARHLHFVRHIEHGIRGVFASASLKVPLDVEIVRRMKLHPRRVRLGLIEGLPCWRRLASAEGRIRGVFASASLKGGGDVRVGAWWHASEACSPRPH